MKESILWEIAEYVTFIRNSPELETAYVDTLWDLVLGLTGSTLAGAGVALSTRMRKRNGSEYTHG